ncbi:unnamed protein product [Phaedon cochleariae]|uniref:Uncharacterized protein n=1 Tax=Phaedon cochleariae TaxID=80249 RepID=A0A9N9X3S6_PHACE|nr:unnamed protein product [Phaedon cochleariae]
MSPEINGISGNPPSVVKRKKNREKKPPQQTEFDLNPLSNCNYFPVSAHPYHNPNYYSFLHPTEPMSLPVYPPNYPSYTFMGRNLAVPQVDSEYMSLPIVNMEQNDESNKRRFSDPGLPNESDSSANSMDERIVQKLTHQVDSLRESNRRLSREVMELRVEVNMMKQQHGMRHYDREYEPGMLADAIREVRDAARVREDALIARVKHLIEEKQLNLNHMHLVTEKNKNNDRISMLEEQLKKLSMNNIRSDDTASASPNEASTNSARQVLELEREALELRRELQDTRAKKEESDQKLVQLDRKLANLLRRSDICTSDLSTDDNKTASIESLSIITTSSMSQGTPRVTLTGPVTAL